MLTVKNPGERVKKDLSLMKDISYDLPIFHTYSLEISRFRNKLEDIITRRPFTGNTRTVQTTVLLKAFNELLGGLHKVISPFFMIPDEMMGWIPHTVLRAWQLMKQKNINVLCTTSPPHSTHLVGLMLKKIFNFTWIVDFRDPWTDNFTKRRLFKKVHYRKILERIMERNVLEVSDRVITVSPGHSKNLIKVYDGLLEKKNKIITNGFDEADFGNGAVTYDRGKNSKFVITHIGTVYPGKSLPFLMSLKELVKENPYFMRNVVIKFVGILSADNLQQIARLGLEDYIQIKEFKERDYVIQDMLSSDLLLLMIRKEKDWIPGKLFEYIRSKKPILVIGSPGQASEIALKSGLGIVASDKNISEIKNKLLEVFHKKMNSETIVTPNDEYIKKFDRRVLTREFARVLDETL